MDYLVSQLWLFMLAAFVVGLIVGWVTCGTRKNEGAH